ncbi:MAG: SPOR domain-containing protein [Pseudomonadota bacterium]
MADLEFGSFSDHMDGTGAREGASVSQLVNWAGAAVSLALVCGLGLWGWELLKRDATGVPVVRALEGPMRVAPEDPGGVEAAHQGLAVNRIAADEPAAPPPEEVVLAPAPLDLAEEDLPMASLLPDTPGDAETVAPSASDDASAAVPDADTAPETAGGETLSAIELAIAEALGVEPDPAVETSDLVPASAPGVVRSPRPALRPNDIVRIESTAFTPETPAATTDAAAPSLTDVPVGTRLVQLGAFESAADAEAAWTTLSRDFTIYFGPRTRLIQETRAGGRSFYRLRAMGFEDLSDARRFCAVLVAEDVDCIPVVQR